MALTLKTSGYLGQSYVSALKTGDVPVLRSIGPRRLERIGDTDADMFFFKRWVPTGSFVNPAFSNWPDVEENSVACTDEDGSALSLEKICQIHFLCFAYLPDETASGSATISCTGMLDGFTGMIRPGGELLLGNSEASATSLVNTDSLDISFTSPVNLALEMLIIGKKAP